MEPDLAELEDRVGAKRFDLLLVTELENRALRRSFAAPGGLLRFVEYMWPILEPDTRFLKGWALDAMALHLEATVDPVNGVKITRLLENVCPGSMKSLLLVFFTAWVWGAKERPGERMLSMSYSEDNPQRDNRKLINLIQSPEYQRLYGRVFKLTKAGEQLIETNKTGFRQAVGIRGSVTGKRCGFLLCDDLNNVVDLESETIRDETNRKFKEAVTNRLNDLVNSVIIVIQQRSHEDDVSGMILQEGWPYVHLCIPLLYEDGRHCSTSIGWTDPRGEDGENYWPERYPEEAVQLAMDSGEFAFCTPGESPVLMANLTMKPIRDVTVGDMVVGFTSVENGNGQKGYKQRTTVPVRVSAISRSVRPVVKVTLDSGRTVRCTEDHKWYTRRSGCDTHAEYLPAVVGRYLWRVCDPELPVLTDPKDIRDAGWLGGFYDAEGSYSIQRRKGYEHRKHGLISFTQGTGRNLPLCENLERVLSKFGFDYSLWDHEPRPHQNHNQRIYYLLRPRGSTLLVAQRFLHIARPMKWRDRIIEGAYCSNFLMGRERVISIEPDGEEEVFGLTTTTGNYVVWGLASSNSGQYQQRPEPRGGGILKREYWRDWDPEPNPATGRREFPVCDFVVASLDPAFTSKQENDPAGFGIWGAFQAPDGKRGVILLDAFAKRLELCGPEPIPQKDETYEAFKARSQEGWGLVETVFDRCRRFKVDVLLIENKASGLSVIQVMEKLFLRRRFQIQAIDPKGLDKMARVIRIQPEFSGGYVYAALDKGWAMSVVNECATFPRGSHDDQVDQTTQAIYWMRQNGFLERSEEQFVSREESMKRYKQTPALYNV